MPHILTSFLFVLFTVQFVFCNDWPALNTNHFKTKLKTHNKSFILRFLSSPRWMKTENDLKNVKAALSKVFSSAFVYLISFLWPECVTEQMEANHACREMNKSQSAVIHQMGQVSGEPVDTLHFSTWQDQNQQWTDPTLRHRFLASRLLSIKWLYSDVGTWVNPTHTDVDNNPTLYWWKQYCWSGCVDTKKEW